ncbi:MAG: glycosyltransferase [Pyrobaculum sp.]
MVNITINQDIINKTVNVINKTLEGPVVLPNAPHIPPWLQNALLSVYMVLLIFSLLLISHYIYYARKTRFFPVDPPPPGGEKLSVIIPVKNESIETIVGAVERLLSLSCRDVEILVISDDPPHYFQQIENALKSFPNVRVLRRPNPVGYKGVALNWAMEHAGGDLALFLDVDSITPRDLCDRARAVERREVAFLGWDGYAAVKTPVAKIQLFLYRYLLYHISILGRYFARHPIFALGSGIAVRREFLREVGGFCNCTADDYDLSIKAYIHGGKVAYLPGEPVRVEVPAGYQSFKRQYARWTYNSAYVLSRYVARLLKLSLPLSHKLSIVMNVATHPLMILTTFATMATSLALGYAGVLLPPFYILALQAALVAAAFLQLVYVYKIAKRDGMRFLEVAGRLAQSATLLLTLSPYLTFYVLLGLSRQKIRWHVTPKGLRALGGGVGLYEIALASVATAFAIYATYVQNLALLANSLFLLTVSLYAYLHVAIPSSRLGRG